MTPANEQDRAQVGRLAEAVQRVTGASVSLAWVDQGYTGPDAREAASEHGIALEVVTRPEGTRGFVLLPRQWVVERSFGWAARCRRRARDYERLPETLAGLHYAVFACLMLQLAASVEDYDKGLTAGYSGGIGYQRDHFIGFVETARDTGDGETIPASDRFCFDYSVDRCRSRDTSQFVDTHRCSDFVRQIDDWSFGGDINYTFGFSDEIEGYFPETFVFVRVGGRFGGINTPYISLGGVMSLYQHTSFSLKGGVWIDYWAVAGTMAFSF